MEKAVLEGWSGIEGGPASIEFLNEAPGTVILEDCRCNYFRHWTQANQESSAKSKLKHGGDGIVVLYPQPTDDPNDPLVNNSAS